MKLTMPLTLSCLALLTPLASHANTFAKLGSGSIIYTIKAKLPINTITDFESMNIYMGKWQQGRCQHLTLAGQQVPIPDTQNPSSISQNVFTYSVHADAIQNIESNIYNPPTISPLCVQYELCANGHCYKTPLLIATLDKNGYRFTNQVSKTQFIFPYN